MSGPPLRQQRPSRRNWRNTHSRMYRANIFRWLHAFLLLGRPENARDPSVAVGLTHMACRIGRIGETKQSFRRPKSHPTKPEKIPSAGSVKQLRIQSSSSLTKGGENSERTNRTGHSEGENRFKKNLRRHQNSVNEPENHRRSRSSSNLKIK